MNLLEYLQRSGIPAEERVLRGLIMRGDVLVNEHPQTSTSFQVPNGAAIRIRGQVNRPVSRGYDKIKPVIERSGIKVVGQICADLGASTGGFTQCLLELGAERVYAIDVGYGLLAAEIRNNPRVVVKERTNARLLTAADIPEPLQLVVGDLSFIRWGAVLPAVVPLLAEQAELLLLVKPQFELAAVGKLDPASHGVVKRSEDLLNCLDALYDLWAECGLSPAGVYPAAIRGVQGNQEFFIRLLRSERLLTLEQYHEQTTHAVAEVAA